MEKSPCPSFKFHRSRCFFKFLNVVLKYPLKSLYSGVSVLHLKQSLSLLQAFFKAYALSAAEPTEQSCEEHVQQFEHSHKELESISTREIDTSIISKLQSIEVSEYQSFLPSLLAFFRFRVSTFQAGQISHCVQQWRTLTSDSEILETVLGQRSGFTLTPVQVTPPPQPTWSKTEEEFIDMEIHAKAAPRGGDCTLSA